MFSYLTKVEDRVRRLESLICEILPNADIDTLLSKSHLLSRDAHQPNYKIKSEGGNSSNLSGASRPRSFRPTPAHRPLIPNDEVPDEADGFDWIEVDLQGNELTDGMAALSINPKGTGYFGLASSSVLLRALKIPSNWDKPQFPLEYPPDEEEEDLTNTSGFSIATTTSPASDEEYNVSTSSSKNSPHSFPAVSYSIPSNPVPKFISDTLVDSFFTFYNSSYPLIHEPTYRAQYMGTIPRPPDDVWDLLHNTVMALGSWCINHESSTADLYYYQQARTKLNSRILETGNLPLVQALTLLSNYVQKRNKPNTGWNYLGLAIRMALGLGLYREFPNWKSSPLKQEIRLRVWWVLYVFDAGAAVTFGRPVNLPAPEIVDIKPPMNIHDSQLTADTTLDMVGSLHEMANSNGPTIYSGIIAQSKFCLLTNSIFNRLISKPSPSAEECLEFNKTIMTKFMDELPPYFKEGVAYPIDPTCQWLVLTRYRLLWRVKNFQVIMFRPFVLQRILLLRNNPASVSSATSEAERKCRDICIKSARDTIHLVDEFLQFQQEPSSVAVWYALYFLFQAALIPIICISSEPTSEHARAWVQDVERTKQILLSLNRQNKLAARFYDVLERLLSQYVYVNANLGEDSNGTAALGGNGGVAGLDDPQAWMSDISSLVFDLYGSGAVSFELANEPIIM